jgi:hypothetical protein
VVIMFTRCLFTSWINLEKVRGLGSLFMLRILFVNKGQGSVH